MIEEKWNSLAIFQIHIAERWFERAGRTKDLYARFFFLFAGFNALYYLWRKVDNLRGGDPKKSPNEGDQIRHLIARVKPEDRATILQEARRTTEFFKNRGAIERMDSRSAGNPMKGNSKEGREALEDLVRGNDSARLAALGTILYLIRCNLVHGGKMDEGDDEKVIQASGTGLQAVLKWAIAFTWTEIGEP